MISMSNFLTISSLLALCCFPSLCHSFPTHDFNSSTIVTHWSSAVATWYGNPDGAGSDGGSCGYGDLVYQAPFSSMVTGIGPSLYNSGKECGACYMVKCTEHSACSGRPVRVTITDFCPGGPCLTDSVHFDLSGTAFGAMAIPGEEGQLRGTGTLRIRYSRVACDYSGKTVAFHVDEGSNPCYFAVVIEFEGGDGDLACVDLKPTTLNSTSTGVGDNHEWWPMQQLWGAVWMLNAGVELQPPFSIRLTSQFTGQTLVAKNVIPAGWKPGATYRSLVNYL